jgi:hypothetical protein
MNITEILLIISYIILNIKPIAFNIVNSLKHSKGNSLNSSNYHFDEVVMPILNQSIESKTLNSFTKKLLRKTLNQNENYNKEFNECYEKLSRHFRILLLMSTKFNEKEKKKDSDITNINYSDKIKNIEQETGSSMNLMTLKVASILHKEINFYLLV